MLGFSELSTPVKFILALAFVLVLIVIAGIILRKLSGARLKLQGGGGRSRQPRLGVVDIFELDRQRQLVLLRRDNVEHLVMIGGPNDVVVEASIQRAGARAQAPASPAEAAEPLDLAAPIAAPQPPIMPVAPPPPPTRKPEPAPMPEPAPLPSAAPAAKAAPPPPPAPSLPKPQAVVGMAAAGVAIVAGAMRSSGERPAPRELARPPSPPEPRPALQTSRQDETPAPNPPPRLNAPAPAMQPDSAATLSDDEITASFEAELAKLSEAPPVAAPPKADRAAAPPEPPKPIIEPIARPADLTASPTELDDMTRQLQEALRRPFSGVRPPSPPDGASSLGRGAAALAAGGAALAAAPAAIAKTQPPTPEPEAHAAALEPDSVVPEPEAHATMPEPEAPAAAPEAETTPEPEAQIDAAASSPEAPDLTARRDDSPDSVAEDVPGDVAAFWAHERGSRQTAVDAIVFESVVTADTNSATQEDVSSTFDIEKALAAALSSDMPKVEPHVAGPREDAAQPPPPPAADAELAALLGPQTPPSGDGVLPAREAPPAAQKDGADSGDPFSMQSIEAEFARLLNRTAAPKG